MSRPRCLICGSRNFSFSEVLWPALCRAWQLGPDEIAYINRQQGLQCCECSANLRSQVLAKAIMQGCNFSGLFQDFVKSNTARSLRILEINQAGTLHAQLKLCRWHRLVEYPAFDLLNLAIPSADFDLVVHSDTLEHIADPLRGLQECRRVLVDSGKLFFTVPVVVGRMTRSREGLAASHHGHEENIDDSYIVHTEFGCDVWKMPIEAGFGSVTVHTLEYPAGIALEARN